MRMGNNKSDIFNLDGACAAFPTRVGAKIQFGTNLKARRVLLVAQACAFDDLSKEFFVAEMSTSPLNSFGSMLSCNGAEPNSVMRKGRVWAAPPPVCTTSGRPACRGQFFVSTSLS